MLKSVNSDILVEFRKNNVGYLMRKYVDMFRTTGFPYSVTKNCIKTTNVRLFAGKNATRADLIMWLPEGIGEAVALDLLNIIFFVPRISVRLGEYLQLHKGELKFWLGFWNKNRDALVNGRFDAHSPVFNSPLFVCKFYK